MDALSGKLTTNLHNVNTTVKTVSISSESIPSVKDKPIDSLVETGSSLAKEEPVSSKKELVELMENMNEKLSSIDNYMQFHKDSASGRDVFILMDSSSHEVIKQFPSKDFLHVSARLTEYLEAQSSKHELVQGDVKGGIVSEIV